MWLFLVVFKYLCMRHLWSNKQFVSVDCNSEHYISTLDQVPSLLHVHYNINEFWIKCLERSFFLFQSSDSAVESLARNTTSPAFAFFITILPQHHCVTILWNSHSVATYCGNIVNILWQYCKPYWQILQYG